MTRDYSTWTVRLALLALGVVCISRGYSQTYAGGAGTAASPYQIATLAQLQSMQYDDGTKNYVLTADIDASATATWNSSKGFLPIPTEFVGTFDGQGHTITGLTINRAAYYVGLFQTIGEGAVVQNLKLVNVNIHGKAYAGGLAGEADGLIANVSVTGTVVADEHNVGGLVGSAKGFVRNCWVNGTISGTENVGGIAGYAGGANIWRSYSLGSVTGKGQVGGLVGNAYSFTLSHSYSRATLAGDSLVGGLVGNADLIYFTNNWAATPITTKDKDEGGLVARCYTSCKAVESYWEKTVSGVDSSKVGTLKTTADLKTAATYAAASWDLGYLWTIDAGINDGFPTNSKTFSGIGRGTLSDPFQIKTLEQLQEIRLYPWAHYALMNDINASATKGWNGGKGFRPNQLIGSSFNGKGFSIDSLYINRPTEKGVGLFSIATDLLFVKNLTLDSASIVGLDSTGALAGFLRADSLFGIKAVASVKGAKMSGGMFGSGGATVVKSLTFDGDVTGTIYVGGLGGLLFGGSAYSLKANAAVTGDSIVGVVCGEAVFDSAKVAKWTGLGSVTGKYTVGGLAGSWYKGNLDSSSTTAKVSGIRRTGGLIGDMNCPWRCKISNSYAENTVTVTDMFGGGLIGLVRWGTLYRTHAKTNVVATQASFVGGLAGYVDEVKVDSSWAEGLLNGYTDAGGLLGAMSDGADTVMRSWSTVTVTSGANSPAIGGLIGTVHDGLVQNSYATGSVSGNSHVGGLVGLNYGWIQESYATGKVVGKTYVGGLVGSDSLSRRYTNSPVPLISKSYATGAVEGYQDVGGLVGHVVGGIILKSYAAGSVQGTHDIGGLVGYAEGNYVQDESLVVGESSFLYACHATGAVTGLSPGVSTGGLVGLLSRSGVMNSYATGSAKGNSVAGGLVGNLSYGKIYTSYSIGEVSGVDHVGGLVGVVSQGTPVVENSFWNTTTSKQTSSAAGEGATSAELKSATFLGDAGFDMKGMWNFSSSENSGYPGHIAFSGSGTGTKDNPYQISSALQLQQIQTDPLGNYVLTKTLDLAETKTWNGGKGWAPLCGGIGFLGSLNGKGYALNNLWINRPEEDNVGLFATLARGLSNLSLKSAEIVGRNMVGGFIGEGVSLYNDVPGAGSEFKMLAVEGKITGKNMVGGILGSVGGDMPEESYSNSAVKGDSLVGGLAGYATYGVARNSYVRGSVTGRASVGGIYGGMYSNGAIWNSYVAAKVTGEDSVEALIGGTYGLSYVQKSALWDEQVYAGMDSRSGTALNTSAMKQQASYEDYDFDFDNIWAISSSVNNGYPYLRNLGKPTTSNIRIADRQILQGLAQLRMQDGFVVRVSEEDGLLQVVDLRGNIVGTTTAERLSIQNLMSGVYIAQYRGVHGAMATMRFQVSSSL